MLTSTALVLLMTIPGLALFYAGMVRKKNILATMMQSFAICCIVTIVWCVAGYSIAFTTGNEYMGDFSRIMLNGIADHIVKGNDTQAFVLASGIKDVADMSTTIPETVYMMFQMTFAIITPALIAGAFADRMKFSAMCIFMTLWSLLVYSPIAHWVWAPSGWATQMGILDFAGGTVVHINAGIAGLMCALVLGKRVGYGSDNMAPYNLSLAVIGASLLWVGWFGFNAGSAVAANGRAGMAMTVTQIATAAAALGWMFAEWITKGKPSVLGAISGAVAGLVAITPASGFVLPGGVDRHRRRRRRDLLLGRNVPEAHAGLRRQPGLLRRARHRRHRRRAADRRVRLRPAVGHRCLSGWHLRAAWPSLKLQAIGVCSTLVYSGVMTFILLMITKALVGLRVGQEEEREGLDHRSARRADLLRRSRGASDRCPRRLFLSVRTYMGLYSTCPKTTSILYDDRLYVWRFQ